MGDEREGMVLVKPISGGFLLNSLDFFFWIMCSFVPILPTTFLLDNWTH
jgi:hypothetical protein